jgi:uracil-DNA glycosylase
VPAVCSGRITVAFKIAGPTTNIADQPRSLRDPVVHRQRTAMLLEPHIAPLSKYAARLRAMGRGEVPNFDPLDGGTNAQVLFLFEKPGPMTSEAGGSGFISRNNDDPTAEATFLFMDRAGIRRGKTVTWNVIPWWNGTRKITPSELQEGLAQLKELIALLPQLCAIVFVGARAAQAQKHLAGHLAARQLSCSISDHPSPLVRAKFPDRWNNIPTEWAKVRSALR